MKRRSFRFCINSVVLLLVCLTATATAQDDPSDTTRIEPPVAAADTAAALKVDTTLYQPSLLVPPAARVTNPADLETHLSQNPTGALFKSMLVPGLGQIGNRKYWKAGLAIGLEGWLFGMAIKRGGEASDAKKLYLAEEDDAYRPTLYTNYDELRKSRNKYYWFGGLVIFISMFDAYVDAHLSGSPTDSRNDKFEAGLAPDPDGGLRAQIAFKF